MSATLDTRAEIIKLERLLDVGPEALAYLRPASADDLARLREQVTDAMFAGDRARLHRLAAASRIVPAQVAAKIAERALGPLLCARLTGLVEPRKAIDVAKHLEAPFLADVAVQIDPRRAKDVIARVPAKLVTQVAVELVGREEHVTMGRFVGYVGDDSLRAAIAEIDDTSLLRIAFVMEGKERLDHLISLLPGERLPRIIRAAEDEGLWPEALDLIGHLGEARRTRLGDLAATQDDVLGSLARTADEQGLWDAVLPVVPAMSEDSQRRVAAMAASLEEPVLRRVIAAVHEHDLWALFVPLAADHMDTAGRERVAEIVADVDDATIHGLADAVEREGLWAQLLLIADRMTAEQLSGIAERMLGAGVEDMLRSVIAAADESGLWATGLGLFNGLEPATQQRIVGAFEDEALLTTLVEAVTERDLWAELLPIAEHLPARSRDQIAALAATLDEEVLEHVVGVVNEEDLWALFVPLAADHMDTAGRERVAEVVADVDEAVINGLADALEREGLWAQLLLIADRMTPRQLDQIADRLLDAGLEERLPSLLVAVEETGLWETGLRILAGLDPELQEKLAAPAATLATQERARVVERATSLGLLNRLGPIAAALEQSR